LFIDIKDRRRCQCSEQQLSIIHTQRRRRFRVNTRQRRRSHKVWG